MSTFSKQMKRKSYKGIGKCIYCLNSFEPRQLTDEHIIPKALLGTLIFKNAVCNSCQEITNVKERQVLKDELLIPRVLLELTKPNSKHKLPLVSLTAVPGDFNASFDIKLPAAEYPKVISNINIGEPGLLTGVKRYEIESMQMQHINLESGKKPIDHASVAYQQQYLAGAIEHMVAKIAYSYAIAEKGIEYFDSTEIRKVLLEDGDEIFNHVGSAPPTDVGKSAHLHWLSFIELKGYFVCRVQLFGSIGMDPRYVVLGKRLLIS